MFSQCFISLSKSDNIGIRAWFIIEKLKFLNLEVPSGKNIDTKDNINIKCRINPSEDHSCHTQHSQLNLIVDLLYNFYLIWGKRQDELEIKLEKLYKEHSQLADEYLLINNNLNLALQILKESNVQYNKIIHNSDYIKEKAFLISKKLDPLGNLDKKIVKTGTEELKVLDQEVTNIKNLIEKVKTLVLS